MKFKTLLEEIDKNDIDIMDAGESAGLSLEDIAKLHEVDIEDINEQYKKGLEVEKEHTNDEEVAGKITRDHLSEDPEYYDKLAKMEAGDCNINESIQKTITISIDSDNNSTRFCGRDCKYLLAKTSKCILFSKDLEKDLTFNTGLFKRTNSCFVNIS